MADAINFSKTQRIVLLIDLNPLLQSQNPNPNYITSIVTTSKILLSFSSLSSSLFSFRFFFSSLPPHLSASTLDRILPNYVSASLSFNSPPQTLNSITETLNSLVYTQLTYSPSNCSHTASSLLQLARYNVWESDIEIYPGTIRNDVVDIRSNLIILLSPVCRSLKDLAEFMCVDVNEKCVRNLDCYRDGFRNSFGAVSDAFNSNDIHLCWIDIHNHEEKLEKNESEQEYVLIQKEIRKFGWGFCSSDSVILGSALVFVGLIYPNIIMSPKLLDSCRSNKRIHGQLNLQMSDVHGKPLEVKCCDLELLHFNDGIFRTREIGSSKSQGVNSMNTFLGRFSDGIIKMHVTALRRYTECEHFEAFSSDFFFVQLAKPGKKCKDVLDHIFADRVLELLAGENSELFEKHTVPNWQIFLNFLYKEGYWALLSLSNDNGDSYMAILKPFTVHSAILLLADNNHLLTQNPSGKYVQVSDVKRRKMKKHTLRDLTWSSFHKAAYDFADVDLSDVYFTNFLKRSKRLKFLKYWIDQVKKHGLSHTNIPQESSQTVPDSNQQKDPEINENLTDQSRIQESTAIASCSETAEEFFSNLPNKIQHGLESKGIDLKTLAERLVNSSVYWARKKHETLSNLDESCTVQVSEIIKLLLREPKDLKKDLKKHKDNNNNQDSTSEYIVREYELQILLRLEILQSEYAESIEGIIKTKLVKQVCSLLEIIQYLVEGGFHGNLSLYEYVERTIKSRYSKNLGDVIDKIYDQMDLLPFGEEIEDQAIFNSEDSNQSLREIHDRYDTSANKIILDSLSLDDESCQKVNISQEQQHIEDDHARKLNEARERRERARRFVSFTRMPDLQRVWAPKQSKPIKVKPEPKRKKQRRVSYSVVCETPLVGNNKASCSTRQNNSVSKALFQDDR